MATRDPQTYLDTAHDLLALAYAYSPSLMTSPRDMTAIAGIEALAALAAAHIAMAECTYRASWWETSALETRSGSND